MRSRSQILALVVLACALTLACQKPNVPKPTEDLPTTRDVAGDDTTCRAPAEPKASDDSTLPKDLGTRKTGEDWPCFLGPRANSTSTEKGILTKWPKEGPKLVWSRELHTGYGMPAISRGRLFLFEREKDTARLSALESETGKLLWKFEYTTDYDDMYGYNNGPRCCPVVDDDRVYIYGPEGMLHCVNVEDGKLRWKVDTRKDFHVVQNFFGVGSTPVVEGDLLIAQVGGSTRDSGETIDPELKGNGSGIVAFEKKTGKVKYKSTDELASYSGPVMATIDKRRWGFVFARGGLVGFEPATGKVDFHYPWKSKTFESVNASNPVVIGDKVFISETYSIGSALLQVKPGGYKEIWTDADKGRREKSLMTHWNTAIHHDGYLYACSGRNTPDANLRCIELATGKVIWVNHDLSRTSLLAVDGHLVCLGEYGELLLLRPNPKNLEVVAVLDPDSKTGKMLNYPCWAAPILSHGLLYVRGEDQLLCLELIPEKK